MSASYIGQISPADPARAAARVLIDATNAVFWQLTGYKPGQRLDMSDPRDREMSKKWLDVYKQIEARRAGATSLAQRAFSETATPYILIVENRDGSLMHQEFPRRGNLDVQYMWLVNEPDLYSYVAMFDFTQHRGAPIVDQFALLKRAQRVATSG
jgi:hypothetical protein